MFGKGNRREGSSWRCQFEAAGGLLRPGASCSAFPLIRSRGALVPGRPSCMSSRGYDVIILGRGWS